MPRDLRGDPQLALHAYQGVVQAGRNGKDSGNYGALPADRAIYKPDGRTINVFGGDDKSGYP